MAGIALPEQGRAHATGYPPIDMSWCFPDPDTSLPIYLLVSAPLDRNQFEPHDLHWSLGWEVHSNVWRHVNVLQHDRPDQPAPNPRLVFWGPLTKMNDNGASETKQIPLAVMKLATRKRIEELAWTVPVLYPNGWWNCQDWLLDLFERMRAEGLITEQKVQEAVRDAREGKACSCGIPAFELLTLISIE
ncbi:hypothetical protein BN946_scf184845.g40 [Trametes cinnabarina]|uniref:Uncharacterized protein n=1 Tax=Pycnoporus cinnabarinus TaxID=5643 RepID=A0A060S9Z6_PYCCI|nr:hypothetical protein BN946_scf184845.g40 [Trametes cinnabarina]